MRRNNMQKGSNTDKKLEFYFTESEQSSLPTTDVPVGSKGYEVDTGKVYTFYNGEWYDPTAEENNG